MEIINSNNFKEKIKDGIVLVDFFADWCGPCKMLAPELEKVAAQMDGQVRVFKVNVDDDPNLARQFNVVSIPNMVLFKEGEPVAQTMGFQPKDKLIQFISKVL